MRLQYLFGQAMTNLRRNALVVVSAVLAVWVTMTMVYAAVVMREVVDDSTGRWKDGIRVLAFLTDDLSFDEIDSLRVEVQGWEQVESVTFCSKSCALDEFRELFADQPSLIEVVEEDPSTLPASLLLMQLEPRLGISPSDLRPIDNMPDLACPVCVASGTADHHTTVAETKAMFAAARSKAESSAAMVHSPVRA